jgi:uncharacterized protein
MITDSLSTWLGFLTSPAAPKGVMSPMELDGYLTGIVVSPDLLRPIRWIDGIWRENEPTFDGLDQMQTVIAAVMDHYNAITAALDAGFKQIEASFCLRPHPSTVMQITGLPIMVWALRVRTR